jgi:IS1 family transposase
MNRLSTEKRAQVVACLVEGNSIRATVRMTGVAKNTVTKLLVDLGEASSRFQDDAMQDLDCERIEIDEIWAFCYAKKRNVPASKKGQFGYGDVWTWVALDADTKLIPSFLVGERNSEDAIAFVADLQGRLKNRVQVSTDGHHLALYAMRHVFEGDVDYGTIHKYFQNAINPADPTRRYSPGRCTAVDKRVIAGDPDPDTISTSYVERANLTMRMGMRRFTRLTNAFSKKVENLAHAVSLHLMHYNYCRPHQTLSEKGRKVTPAMAAGLTDHVWTLQELVGLLESN